MPRWSKARAHDCDALAKNDDRETRSGSVNRAPKLVGIALLALCTASFALAKDKKPKPGLLTGTWECMSHGSSQGDLPFTLHLEQDKKNISGSVSSPMGGTQISSGTYVKKTLEVHLDTPQGGYTLTAKFKNGQLTGEWSSDEEKGKWEGKKQAKASQ